MAIQPSKASTPPIRKTRGKKTEQQEPPKDEHLIQTISQLPFSPLVLPSDLQSHVVGLLHLVLPMLPSINNKLKRGRGNRLYINPTYRVQEAEVQQTALIQVREQGWTYTDDEVYIIWCHFVFAKMNQDVDGPYKAMCDALQGIAISDDNRVMAYHPTKYIGPKGTPGTITILKMPSALYRPINLLPLYLSQLTQSLGETP